MTEIYHSTSAASAAAILIEGFRPKPWRGGYAFFGEAPITSEMNFVRSAEACVAVTVPGDFDLEAALLKYLPSRFVGAVPQSQLAWLAQAAVPLPRIFAIQADVVNTWPMALHEFE
jgi:hypothetical protein